MGGSSDKLRQQSGEPIPQEQEPPVFEKATHAPGTQRPDVGNALEVEELDANLYRSKTLWLPYRARGVFGGQVIAQAVAAARKTVRPQVFLHSLHCYFLLAGDNTVPILYHVSLVRDGGSYVTRSVNAVQRGKSIFTIILSYQKPEPDQPRFAIPPPCSDDQGTTMSESVTGVHAYGSESKRQLDPTFLPHPDQCPSNELRYQNLLETRQNLDPKIRTILQEWTDDRKSSPVEIRDALLGMYDVNGNSTPGNQQAFWMRTKTPMIGGIEQQKIALTYLSDFHLLSNVPKTLNNSRNIKMMASLDHSMWFYDTFRVDDWLLYVMQTQAVSNGRGVVLARIYRLDGTLVAVVAQEGMVRVKTPAITVTNTRLSSSSSKL